MPKGYHVHLGWNLKRIRETFGVPIFDCQLAICVSTPIESMIPEQELSLRVLVSSRSNLVAFGEYAKLGIVDGRAYFGKCPQVITFSWGGT
jgi:hypothetical protein